MIAKVLDKDTSLAKKIRTLFREQGITIASILMAIGLLPGGGASAAGGEPPPPKNERLKRMAQKQTQSLSIATRKIRHESSASMLQLPCIIGAIISWVLNKAMDVVGWVSQNLWALVVVIGGLLFLCIWSPSNYIMHRNII